MLISPIPERGIRIQEYTLADISHLMMGIALGVIIERDILGNEEERPNVARWFKNILSRPAVVDVKKEWIEYLKQRMQED